jgi:hypothetical protein
LAKLWWISILIAVLVCVAPPCAALTIGRALENPVHLADVGDAPLVYLSYSSDLEEVMAAYTEYDAYAKGYGGFVVRYGGEKDETILSAVVVKEIDDLDLGIGIHWITGSESAWLMDLGGAYSIGPVGVHLGIHDVPFTRWKDITEESYFSAGASFDLSEAITVGIDTRFLEEPLYKGYALFSLRPDLKAQVYVLYQDSDWDAVGVDAWMSRGAFLLHAGYKMNWDKESLFCVGIGYRL